MMKHESPSISEKNQWTWKFDTMLRNWNSVLRCNMMTSQQIQYGGQPPYWKSSFGYISAIYCPINAKFCMSKQNHVQTPATWPKYQILKIQDGGRPPFWKWFYRYISAADHPISMKYLYAAAAFGSKDGHVTKYQNIANSKWRTAAILNIVFWLYLCDLLSD